jgi:uncharacterized protein YabE (DUF348 family)
MFHTGKLLSKLRTSKKLALQLTSALIVSSSVGTAAYAATKENVTIELDGKKQVVYTHADTVKELLKDEEIKVANRDYISASLSEEVEDNMKLVIAKAKPFTLDVNGKSQTVWSTVKTVQELLDQQKIQLGEHDKVTPERNTAIQGHNTIKVETAFPVILNVGGQQTNVWSTSITVADFLKQQQVALQESDKVTPALDQLLAENTPVTVTKVEKVTDVVEEPIPAAVVKQKDDSLPAGTEKVLQEGEDGTIQRTFEVVKENGVVTARNLQKEEKLKDSQDRIIAVGTKNVENYDTPSRGNEAGAADEFYVEATAYGPDCGGCTGITASGYNIKTNPNMKMIAVDPSVIPLGSKVWVEGYGYAIAGDTGGAIKGHRIDVLYPSEAAASSWGRKRVKVRVLR